MAHYPLDGNAVDFSGNGLDGIVNGAFSVENRRQKSNKALEFNGIDTNVDLGDILDNVFTASDANFSLSFWIYLNGEESSNTNVGAIAPNNLIISKLGDSACGEDQREFTIRVVDDKLNGLFFYSLDSQVFRRWVGETTLTADTWYHVVVNYDESIINDEGAARLSIFLDGVQESLTLDGIEGALGELQDGTAHLGLGNRLDSNGENCATDLVFNGRIDDLRIYDRLLDNQEISILRSE